MSGMRFTHCCIDTGYLLRNKCQFVHEPYVPLVSLIAPLAEQLARRHHHFHSLVHGPWYVAVYSAATKRAPNRL